MPLSRAVLAAAAVVALLAAACTGGDAPPGAGTPTSPAAPAAGDGTAGDGTGTSPDGGSPAPPTGPTAQTLLLGPQEARELPTSERAEDQDERGLATFVLVGRSDGGALPDQVALALYPCRQVRLGPPEAFADGDGDGAADGIGATDTGAAVVASVNDEPSGTVAGWPLVVAPAAGEVRFALNSFDPDCAVPVVFVDEDGDGQLAVDVQGVPTEPFGAGKVIWVRGS